MFCVAVITAALIMILSVFNGLGDLLHSLNNSFDPEIKIQPTKGKSFEVTDRLLESIRKVDGVQYVTEVIEDYAYVRYGDANQVVVLKGVSDNFIEQKRIPESALVEGDLKLRDGSVNYAIVGDGVKYTLSIGVGNNMYPLQVFYIKDVKAGVDPSQLYSKRNILVGGVFSIVQQFNESYVIVPIDFAKDLLNYENKRTSLEIKTTNGAATMHAVQARLKQLLGDDFKVLNEEEQHQDLYRLLKLEKLFSFVALAVLLFVGSINIFFCLMMLALDKKKDISILSAMGATQSTIRNIFLTEGILIALVGTISGLVLGASICWLQQNYGIISMGLANAVMDSYPVKLVWSDFIWTLATVVIITMLISLRPAVLASRVASVQEL